MDSTKPWKKEVAYFMRRLYKRGLTTTSGGNISLRLSDNVFLVTPSQTDKGRMKADEVVRVDRKGRKLSQGSNPSMETALHLAIYHQRPDINCIVHAHPPFSTAFAAARKNINTAIIGEAYAIVGKPVVAEYALMGSTALAEKMAEAATIAQVLLMANHGVMALGKSLLEAFDRLEVLENCARIELATKAIGDAIPLGKSDLEAIEDLMKTKK
jgi:L-fuculose-phosphate aldolase